MWLFGQLDTIGQTEAQAQTDENARVVGSLLEKFAQRQYGVPASANGDAETQAKMA